MQAEYLREVFSSLGNVSFVKYLREKVGWEPLPRGAASGSNWPRVPPHHCARSFRGGMAAGLAAGKPAINRGMCGGPPHQHAPGPCPMVLWVG